MSELRAILIQETELARQLKIADRFVWVPKSITKTITKFAPDVNGHRECIADVDEWFLEKNGIYRM